MTADVIIDPLVVRISDGDLVLRDSTDVGTTLSSHTSALEALKSQINDLNITISNLEVTLSKVISARKVISQEMDVYDNKLIELRKPLPGWRITPSEVQFGDFVIAQSPNPPIVTGFLNHYSVKGEFQEFEKKLREEFQQLRKDVRP